MSELVIAYFIIIRDIDEIHFIIKQLLIIFLQIIKSGFHSRNHFISNSKDFVDDFNYPYNDLTLMQSPKRRLKLPIIFVISMILNTCVCIKLIKPLWRNFDGEEVFVKLVHSILDE